MTEKWRFPNFVPLALAFAACCVTCDGISAQTFSGLVENWRWSRYWFGSSGVDDVYASGKNIAALLFWTKQDRRPKSGLCSIDLQLCVAYSGQYFDPHTERIQIRRGASLQEAFKSFVDGSFGGDEAYIGAREKLHADDFELEEIAVTLPELGLPSSIANRTVPAEASLEAGRLERTLGCRPLDARPRRLGCSGTLVFAYYGPNDPYWFVWRTCTASCEFGGDAIEELTRGDTGWEMTSRGFISSPKAEVERLRRQVQKAEMFRLKAAKHENSASPL